MNHANDSTSNPGSIQTPPAANPEMIYIKVPVGALQCNCAIIGDPRSLEAIVIDPGDEVERILSLIGRYKLIIKMNRKSAFEVIELKSLY